MDKITIDDYLTDLDPAAKDALEASSFFRTDTQEFTNPDERTIALLLSQGWTIVTESGSGTSKKYTFERNRVDVENLLQELINDYTEAYNEGRELNDTRYDDIIALWAACLDKTEDDLNDDETQETVVYTDMATMIDNLDNEFDTYETEREGAYDDWGTAEENRINDHYDDLISSKRAELISRGLYDTTWWDAIETGIERERTDSLTELADRQIVLQDKLKDRLYSHQVDMRQKLIAARTRLDAQLQAQGNARITLRNRVLEAVCRFAERREDTYPALAEVGKLANSLGANNPTGFVP